MPTKADFELAAVQFDAAAQQVGALTSAAESAGAADILRGGSLGRQVPERIAAAAAAAVRCQQLITVAANTCRERVAIIDEYEQQLAQYDELSAQYQSALYQWEVDYSFWVSDWEGWFPNPGPMPSPPPKPSAPPSWADVRRP